MVDAVQVAVAPGQIPGLPAGVPALPSAAAQVPGFTPAAEQGKFSQEDINRAVAEAVAASRAAPDPSVQPVQSTPSVAPVTITSTANDDVLNAFTEGFSALGAGIDMDRAFGKALTFGKPELIDSAYIAEKGGAHAKQLEVLAKSIVAHVQSKANEGVNSAHSIAGGPDNWNAASAAFNKDAPEHVKQVVVEMLNSGNLQKVTAGAKMVVDFATNGGLLTKQPGMVQAGVAGGLPSQALDKEGFQAALGKLNQNDRNFLSQRNALFAARKAGKLRGL